MEECKRGSLHGCDRDDRERGCGVLCSRDALVAFSLDVS